MKKVLLLLLILLIPFNVMALSTSAECEIVMEQNSKRVFQEKNIHKVKSVASISKIMTAILAIESGQLDDIVVVDEIVLEAYGSAIYIKEGEEISLLDLVYGLMLRSGNDASLVISKYVAGDVASFVNLMNKKAQEIGMKRTIFNNPSGLDNDKGNYSTAYDMALLTCYAMENKVFQKITKTKSHTVKTNLNVYKWENKNKLLNLYKYATGGKTGYTELAKRTLVTAASQDNLDLVIVTLNDGNDFFDHQNLYEEVFANYKNYQILKAGELKIIGENYYNKKIYIKNSFSYPLLEKELDSIYLKFEIDKKRNYKNNDKIGVLKVMQEDVLIYSDDLYIDITSKKKQTFWEWFKNIW